MSYKCSNCGRDLTSDHCDCGTVNDITVHDPREAQNDWRDDPRNPEKMMRTITDLIREDQTR